MRMIHIIRRVQLFLSKQSFLFGFLLKVRNQIDAIIRLRITNTITFEKNGEKKVLEHIVPISSTLVDVGANLGRYTDEILRIKQPANGFKVFLFEPSRNAFNVLKEKFNLNDIEIFNVGLSDEKAERTFFEKDTNEQTSSLFSTEEEGESVRTVVQVDRLDNYMSRIGEIDFCKIDAEGNDYYVLKGAENYLKEHKIKFLQFEYGPNWILSGSTLFKTLEYLNNLDYRVFLVRQEGLFQFKYNRWGEYFGYSNYFAVSRRHLNLISDIIVGSF